MTADEKKHPWEKEGGKRLEQGNSCLVGKEEDGEDRNGG